MEGNKQGQYKASLLTVVSGLLRVGGGVQGEAGSPDTGPVRHQGAPHQPLAQRDPQARVLAGPGPAGLLCAGAPTERRLPELRSGDFTNQSLIRILFLVFYLMHLFSINTLFIYLALLVSLFLDV